MPRAAAAVLLLLCSSIFVHLAAAASKPSDGIVLVGLSNRQAQWGEAVQAGKISVSKTRLRRSTADCPLSCLGCPYCRQCNAASGLNLGGKRPPMFWLVPACARLRPPVCGSRQLSLIRAFCAWVYLSSTIDLLSLTCHWPVTCHICRQQHTGGGRQKPGGRPWRLLRCLQTATRLQRLDVLLRSAGCLTWPASAPNTLPWKLSPARAPLPMRTMECQHP